MALTDDLEDDISRTRSTTTAIKEKHNVAIVRETHAFLRSTDSEIRTFGQSKVSVAAQFEYIVLQKA